MTIGSDPLLRGVEKTSSKMTSHANDFAPREGSNIKMFRPLHLICKQKQIFEPWLIMLPLLALASQLDGRMFVYNFIHTEVNLFFVRVFEVSSY